VGLVVQVLMEVIDQIQLRHNLQELILLLVLVIQAALPQEVVFTLALVGVALVLLVLIMVVLTVRPEEMAALADNGLIVIFTLVAAAGQQKTPQLVLPVGREAVDKALHHL
jgi:hypothetical protein